jgi:hypothetical protein
VKQHTLEKGPEGVQHSIQLDPSNSIRQGTHARSYVLVADSAWEEQAWKQALEFHTFSTFAFEHASKAPSAPNFRALFRRL